MRADVKSLFDRLGKSDFQYRDFGDRFTEVETWPVFEAILRDPRVQQSVDDSVVVASPAPAAPAAPAHTHAHAPEPKHEPAARVQHPLPLGAALSRKYGGQSQNTAARVDQQDPQDVRSLLARISTAVSKGTI